MLKAKFILLTAFLGLAGCYSLKIDRGVASLDSVTHRQNYFLLGLIGDNELNLTDECPRGVAGVSERFTLEDGAFMLFTLGIYSPRTVTVNCQS